MICVVDSGPLYAVADRDDADHEASLAALSATQRTLVIPALVVAEVSYLIGTRLGPHAESRFIAALARYEVEAPLAEEWARISQLVEKYGDLPLGATDASVVALAERLNTSWIATLDARHFRVVRPMHCAAFDLVP